MQRSVGSVLLFTPYIQLVSATIHFGGTVHVYALLFR